jgi:stalled ribosome alternative rescue factor ArfA
MLDRGRNVCYIVTMKRVKARVNKDGLMGSASREHRVKKGKGSFRRHKKHKKPLDR